MSDTPETDEELAELGFGFYTMGGLPADAVQLEFARKLERERDVFEKELFHVREALLAAMPHAYGSTKKLAELIVQARDEAIQSFNIWKEDYKDILAARNSLMCALLQVDSKAGNCENVWETLGQISVITHDTLNLHNKF